MIYAILYLVSILVWGVYFYQKIIKNVHMLQLNSYRIARYWRWHQNALRYYIRLSELVLILVLFIGFYINGVLFFLMWCVSFAVLFMSLPKQTEKKKLVFTARVIRLLVTIAIVTIGSVGCTILFTKIAFELMYVFALFPVLIIVLAVLINHPIESMINQYYISDAKKKIKLHKELKVVGITGSFGKTSVKHFLTTLLSHDYNVLMTPESFNTPLGNTKTIRNMLQPIHEIFISEMGAKQNGDIKEICEIVNPKYGVITAIGEQHLETFKSLDHIITTKFELIQSLPEDGIAFLNLDDKHIADHLKKLNLQCKVITYGINNDDADYQIFNIKVSRSGSTFNVRTRAGETQAFDTILLGEHNIYNVTASIAVANEFGIPLSKISSYVRLIMPVKHRLELIRNGNITILDDSFNSNPVGSKMALTVLSQMPEKKILITPGMVELGEKEYEYNYAFAEAAAEVCDNIILVGIKQTKPMQDALNNIGFEKIKLHIAKNLQEALRILPKFIEGESMVLIENDLPDTYNE